MSSLQPLGTWTDLPRGRSRIIVNGVPHEVIRHFNRWDVWEFWENHAPGPVFRVTRGEEFWAGPDSEWNVPNDIKETFRIVAQGGYDCGIETGGANCSGCRKSKGQVHR